MVELIWAVICGILAIGCTVISILQFNEKGFLFNNAYIWASKKERESMDKKPHYRQSGVVFAFCGAIFLCMTLESVLKTGWLWIVVFALSGLALVYAVISSAKDMNEKNK